MKINFEPKKIKLYLRSLIISIFIGGFLALFFWLGAFQSWEWSIEDNLFLGQEPREDIVIVAIDDQSLQQIGRWPWAREKTAQLIEKISQANPAILGIDINFPEPSEGDEILAQSLAQDFPIVLPVEAVLEIPSRFREPGALVAYEKLGPTQRISELVELGLANTPPDTDGIVRRIPAKVIDQEGSYIPAFGAKIASLYEPTHISLPTDEYERLIINYNGGASSFNYIPSHEVLGPDFDITRLENKIVLVGATAPDLHDVWFTPTAKSEPMPGIEVQANLIQTILNQDFLQPIADWVTIFSILALSVILGLGLPRFRALWNMISFAGLFVLYVLAVIVIFDFGFILNILFPLLSLIFSFVLLTVYRYMHEEGEKKQVKRAFEFYLSPHVIKEVLQDPKKLALGGEKKELTIMFSDIRGFTALSEGLSPEHLTHLLNKYLTQMTEIVLSHDGVLDKYIGDAIMAFWGAPLPQPHHAERAARTALDMVRVLNEFNRDKKWPAGREINIGIGLNTGEVIVGNMGADKRFDYTVIGDAVNLGSRAESLNKQYGTKIIITEFTKNALSDEFVCRLLDKVAVKGKKQPVKIYELICFKNEIAPKQKEVIQLYEQAFELYQNKKWDKAREILAKLAKLIQDDLAVKNLIERCEQFKKHPPSKDWNGVWIMQTK